MERYNSLAGDPRDFARKVTRIDVREKPRSLEKYALDRECIRLSQTMQTAVARGGGPPFRKWSGRPLYRWGDSLAWAQSLLTPIRHSTSE